MDTFSIYKKLPIWLQNKLVSFQGEKLEKLRYNNQFFMYLEDAKKSENWSSEQIIQYKEFNLSLMLSYAYEHVPFYKKHFDKHHIKPTDFTCLADLKKFPILTKDDVRNHFKEMISDEYDVNKLIKCHTSGSTGTALDFYWTTQNINSYWAMVWRGRSRFGIQKGDCHLNFTGKLICPIEQNNPPFWRYNKPANQYLLNMQHITKDKVADIVKFLNESEIRFYTGYPSIINSLALLIDDMGLEIKRVPEFIFTGAEKVYDNQRELIEKVFYGTKIIEHYGFSEEAACASKCICGHYHEDFELGHMELKDSKEIGTGLIGSLLVTGFQNFAMPFIRYEVGDVATFANEKCTCGLNSQLILDVEGRTEDYIVTPEGRHLMRLDYIFKETTTIKEAQVVQRELGSIVIRIVRRENYKNSEENVILNAIRQMISSSLNVYFEYVDEIPRTKAGKFKAVVSELKK